MLSSTASSLARQTIPRLGSHEPVAGYESVGFTPRIGRLAPIVRLAQNRTDRRCMRDTLAAARTARTADIASARMHEPGVAFLPTQDVRFVSRHPRYWSDEERDTFNALQHERRCSESVMQHAPSNEGRQSSLSLQGSKTTVNGSGVRHSARWLPTPRSARPAHWSDECTTRIGEDGERSLFTPLMTDKQAARLAAKTRPKQLSRRERLAARNRAMKPAA
jgi:hypothetical protein